MESEKPSEKEVFSYFTEILDTTTLKPEELHQGAILDAQALYLRFVPVVEISSETGIPISILRDLVYKKGGWRAQRDLMHTEVREQAKEQARKKLQKGYRVAIRLLTNGLLAYEKRLQRAAEDRGEEEISVPLEDLNEIGKLLTRLDKAQLNAEDPLDAKRKSFTPRDLVKAIGADPYLKKSFQSASQDQSSDDEMDAEFIEYDEVKSDSLATPKR